MAALTDAIYVEDEADKLLVVEALTQAGTKLEDFSREWRNQRIRRTIREGKQTQAAVLKVMKEFEKKVCPITGVSVVTAALKEV